MTSRPTIWTRRVRIAFPFKSLQLSPFRRLHYLARFHHSSAPSVRARVPQHLVSIPSVLIVYGCSRRVCFVSGSPTSYLRSTPSSTRSSTLGCTLGGCAGWSGGRGSLAKSFYVSSGGCLACQARLQLGNDFGAARCESPLAVAAVSSTAFFTSLDLYVDLYDCRPAI